MTKNVYLLEWYGPFSTPQDVIEWERQEIGTNKTYIYLFKGKRCGKQKFSYYCGQAFKQYAGKRLTNKGHHINDVIFRPNNISIWVEKTAEAVTAKTAMLLQFDGAKLMFYSETFPF